MDVPYVELDAEYPRKIRLLADAIVATLGDQVDAVDLGCGEGMLVARLREHGWAATGIEGNEKAYQGRVTPHVHLMDLTERTEIAARVRVAICTEVAEHVPEPFANALVSNVANIATKWIVWSAAPPGQEWPGHVNLQPARYWLAKFCLRGWVPHLHYTVKLRGNVCALEAQHAGASESFYVLTSDPAVLEISTKA